MARGMGLPPLPPHGHPLAGHPGVNGAPHLPGPHHVLTSSASGVIGRPTSTPSTGTNAFNGKFVFSTLYRKFEAITHAKGQKTIFLEPFGRLIDLLTIIQKTLYISLCVFFYSNHYYCCGVFLDCKILGALLFNLLSSITNFFLTFTFIVFLLLWFGISTNNTHWGKN